MTDNTFPSMAEACRRAAELERETGSRYWIQEAHAGAFQGKAYTIIPRMPYLGTFWDSAGHQHG